MFHIIRHLTSLTCEKSDVLNAFPKTKWDKETPPVIPHPSQKWHTIAVYWTWKVFSGGMSPEWLQNVRPVFQSWQSRLEVVLYLWYELLNGLKIQTCSCVRWKQLCGHWRNQEQVLVQLPKDLPTEIRTAAVTVRQSFHHIEQLLIWKGHRVSEISTSR